MLASWGLFAKCFIGKLLLPDRYSASTACAQSYSLSPVQGKFQRVVLETIVFPPSPLACEDLVGVSYAFQ